MMFLVLLAACGGSKPSSLLRTDDEPAGDHCAEGGIAVQAGVDDDGDGTLSDDEVDSTTYVCDGEDGASGEDGSSGTTLIATTDEPAGDNCANGGTRLDAGVDDDGDGVLDAEEVDDTTYVCNGADGASGTETLVSVSDEPPGDNCPYGGERVDSGPDTDGSGTLDADEVTASSYVCNGTDGSSGAAALVSTATEPAGDNCADGGVAVSVGTDDDGDGVLDAEEVDTVSYVCDGADGGTTVASTVVAGDYIISNSLDAELLAGVEQITGSLEIAASGITELSLPDLREVGALYFDDVGSGGATELDSLYLPALTTVDDDLFIDDLTVLDGSDLDALTTVGGDVTVYAQDVTGFDMLNALTTVGGELSFQVDDSPTSVGGFDALQSVGSGISFSGSGKSLTSITGFSSLRTVASIQISQKTVTEITGFSSLETVTGSLKLEQLAITDLDSFASLRSVGTLYLYNLTSLTDVTGLSALETVTGDLYVSGCSSLSSLSGLDGLSDVGGTLEFISTGIVNLSPLTALTSAGAVYLSADSSLTSLDGLDNLDIDEGGALTLQNLPALTDISSLSHVSGWLLTLTLSSNSSLTNLDGLEGVTSIGASSSYSSQVLQLKSNTKLADLGGLDGLTTLRYGQYQISGNSALCDSAVTSFKSRFPSASGTWSTGSNKSGC